MALTRQGLTSILTAFTDNAIANGDQRWGRQLASILESHADRLRIAFGNAVSLEGKAKTEANRRSKAKQAKGSQISQEAIPYLAYLRNYPNETVEEVRAEWADRPDDFSPALYEEARLHLNAKIV